MINNQMMRLLNINSKLMNNNQKMQMNNMNNNISNNNQINNNEMQEQIEELDYIKKKIKLYEERIKSLEERIKNKDLEIINLKNRLNSNFYNCQNNLSFNYNLMMMEQMQNFMNNANQTNDNNEMEIQRYENYSKNLTLTFLLPNSNNDKIKVQCMSNERVEKVIQKFLYKVCKPNVDYKYIFNSQELNKDLTVEESGLYNNACIHAVEKKDENQIKNMKQILPLKSISNRVKKNISFISNRNRIFLTLDVSTKVSEAIKIYLKKMEFSGNENHLSFLWNGMRIDINDQRTIEEAFQGNCIAITVIELVGIIGA